jgi:hypothetical protein
MYRRVLLKCRASVFSMLSSDIQNAGMMSIKESEIMNMTTISSKRVKPLNEGRRRKDEG